MAAALTQHPYAAVLRPYRRMEYAELVASVRAHGLQDPTVLLFEGQVLDGWHRYRAASETGQPYVTETYAGPDPVGVVMRANAVRRHLTPQERAEAFVEARAALEAAGATRRQDGRPSDKKAKQSRKPPKNQHDKTGPHGPVSDTPSNTESARQIGVGRKTVDRAEQARTKTKKQQAKRPSKTDQLTAERDQLRQDLAVERQQREAAEATVRLLEDAASPSTQVHLRELTGQRARIEALQAEIATQRGRCEDTIHKLRGEIRALKADIRRLTGAPHD